MDPVGCELRHMHHTIPINLSYFRQVCVEDGKIRNVPTHLNFGFPSVLTISFKKVPSGLKKRILHLVWFLFGCNLSVEKRPTIFQPVIAMQILSKHIFPVCPFYSLQYIYVCVACIHSTSRSILDYLSKLPWNVSAIRFVHFLTWLIIITSIYHHKFGT